MDEQEIAKLLDMVAPTTVDEVTIASDAAKQLSNLKQEPVTISLPENPNIVLTDEEYDFLNFLEQKWFEYGAVPTRDKLSEEGVDPKFFDSCFSKPEFRDAVLSRGISLRGLDATVVYDKKGRPRNPGRTKNDWKKLMLSEAQLAAANVILDTTDTRSQKKKLTDLGISTATWQSWLRDPAFQHYLRVRSENALHDNQHEAHLALVDRVKTGDINAIKYFNELTGRYVPQVNNKAVAKEVAHNFDMEFLVKILEIIQKFVQDSSLQRLIADEMLKLAENKFQTGPDPQVGEVGAVGGAVDPTGAPLALPGPGTAYAKPPISGVVVAKPIETPVNKVPDVAGL